MFYYYFRVFNWVSSLFGLRKPFIVSGEVPFIPLWSKLWSLSIAACALASHLLAINFQLQFHVKDNLDELSNINNVIVNLIVIFNNICKENMYFRLYDNFIKIFCEMRLSNKNTRMICYKLYMIVLIQGLMLAIATILEVIFDDAPYIILTRIPLFLTIYHLIVHLCLTLAILRFINHNMVELVRFNTKASINIFLDNNEPSHSVLSYFLDPKVKFIDVKSKNVKLNFKIFCRIYDDLCTSMNLLQKCHGVEILLSIWMMFTSAVAAITLISNNEILFSSLIARVLLRTQTAHPWLEVLRGIQVYVWFCVGCYVDDQIGQQVELTEVLIVKNLIDFRCDQVSKEVLQTFKLVVNTNRLQFTACNLYRLNFATVLGTVVSVITYSVISIQLF